MKRFLLLISLSQFLTLTAFALEAAEHQDGPCSKLMEACKAAGFNKSNLKDKKSLSKDCLQPLLNDEKVENVKVDDSIIKACKLKKSELKSKK